MDPGHGSISHRSSTEFRPPDDPGSSPTMRAVKDIAFGSIAGMVAEVFEYPFDLAKVRLQSQVLENTARFRGPLDCLVQTWRGEGIRGLYRGLPVPIFGSMAETAALFVAYSQIQSLIQWSTHSPPTRQLTLPELGLAAAGAGFLTSFIMTPMELIKCKMQVQMLAIPPRVPDFQTKPPSFVHPTAININIAPTSAPQKPAAAFVSRKLPGPFTIVSNIVHTSGFTGLWVGHLGTIIRETGGTAAWFACKEFIASLLLARRNVTGGFLAEIPQNQSPELLPWESAVSGALAGGIRVLSLYPADTVKSAIQTVDELRPPDKFTHTAHVTNKVGKFWETARVMYRAHGWRGLYAGCGMSVAKAIPCSGIVFMVYDGLSQRYG